MCEKLKSNRIDEKAKSSSYRITNKILKQLSHVHSTQYWDSSQQLGKKKYIKGDQIGGAWLAQSVNCLTLGFQVAPDLTLCESEPL